MSLPPRQHEQQQAFLRQANILRKNLNAWDGMLHSARGEDWPSMLGRLNAAFNQTGNLDQAIEDAAEHFVYVPQKSTINAQDIAFFLSTRLVTAASGENSNEENATGDTGAENGEGEKSEASSNLFGGEESAKRLRKYETQTAELAAEFEEGMVRF
eukprot:CCRYP_015122-RA/>CCRYP_015122-RA protein AED:0.03 eAED:0.03 QI:219/1/1/1/1/1/2/454/155